MSRWAVLISTQSLSSKADDDIAKFYEELKQACLLTASAVTVEGVDIDENTNIQTICSDNFLIEGEDSDDPMNDMLSIMTIAGKFDANYMAASHPYTERSRGMRADGMIVLGHYNQDTGVFTAENEVVPWKEGDPEPTYEWLKNTFPESPLKEAIAKALFEMPTPKP